MKHSLLMHSYHYYWYWTISKQSISKQCFVIVFLVLSISGCSLVNSAVESFSVYGNSKQDCNDLQAQLGCALSSGRVLCSLLLSTRVHVPQTLPQSLNFLLIGDLRVSALSLFFIFIGKKYAFIKYILITVSPSHLLPDTSLFLTHLTVYLFLSLGKIQASKQTNIQTNQKRTKGTHSEKNQNRK